MSRREFLGVAASLAGTSLLDPSLAEEGDNKLVMPTGASRSRVIQVRSPYATNGPAVHGKLLGEMLEAALMSLVPGSTASAAAWRSLLSPDDVIGIKFNRSGQAIIGTTDALADVLIASICEAGFRPEQIVCIEAPPGAEARLGTRPPRQGYDRVATRFDSGSDQFAAVLGQISALIDVPFLKTHNIAGLTGALKNLSHGLVKHPARYHGNGCSPYIGDIVAAEPVRSRLRLCLVDALRVVYAGGPAASTATLSEEGTLLASTDPVATDTVGLMVLNGIREREGLPPIARSGEEIGYIAAAHRRGLGVGIVHGIDWVRLGR